MDATKETSDRQIKHNSALISLDYKLRAVDALNAGETRDAIYYQTISLGASKRNKYSESSRSCYDLGKIIQKISEPSNQINTLPSAKNAYADLCAQCRELPEEWTVVQISKEFTPMSTCLKHEEHLREAAPIWLTIFRCSDPFEGSRSEPILLPLDPPVDDDGCKYPNFFEHITSIPADTREAISKGKSTATAESPANLLEALEQLIGSAVDRVRDWLGPWSNLFIGKFRSQEDQRLEAEIYNQVEEFCIENRINHTGQRLVSLVARRLDLLQDVHLFELCCSEQLSLDNAQIGALYAMLCDMKNHKFVGKSDQVDSFPVLLVVDELLDSMPWEMIHPTGEFCRFSSFQALSELYRIHKKQMKNGYLSMKAENCFVIINPDKNLEKMSARLQAFYKEWYPDFELLIDQPPTEVQLGDALNQSDVVIYNGHGSGLQFMNGESLLQRDINCVTFLFGCDSVRLFSNGLFTEMTGTHQYYNAAHCPTVIGSLWVLTDFFTDVYSMMLIGSWIPSTNAKNGGKSNPYIDTSEIKKTGKQKTTESSSSARLYLKRQPNLLKLMGYCRLFRQFPQRIRCAMVCRGLPVINELCN